MLVTKSTMQKVLHALSASTYGYVNPFQLERYIDAQERSLLGDYDWVAAMTMLQSYCAMNGVREFDPRQVNLAAEKFDPSHQCNVPVFIFEPEQGRDISRHVTYKLTSRCLELRCPITVQTSGGW